MQISGSSASYSPRQSTYASSRPDPSQDLASALQAIGVGETKAADVVSQFDEALAAAESVSASGRLDRAAVRTIIHEVVEANGVDSAEVGAAIRSSRTAGPQKGGRPQGPPPKSSEDEAENTSSVESALLSSNVDEESLDELLSQLLEAIKESNSNQSQGKTDASIRSAFSDVLKANGIDDVGFQQYLSNESDGGTGYFLNRLV